MATLTIEQIATLAQSSRSTVSRVLNDHPNVRPAVRDRVLRVIKEQGYAPHAAARNLARRRTNVIGLIAPSGTTDLFADPFFGLSIQGVVEASARAGYLVMLSMINPDIGRGLPERILHSQHFDGIIMLFSDIDNPIFPFLKQGKTPLVLCGSHPSFADWTSVDAQHREGAQRAVGHLVHLGHRRIATITGPLRDMAARERRDGYTQGLRDAQLPLAAELIVEGDWTHERGYTAMQELLSVAARPTAVFVASDTMALGAIRAINDAGLRVPDDVALVSFDDLPLASYANPPLTTIRQPIAGGGATAVKLLIDRIEQRDTPITHVRLPTELVVRRSCGATAHDRN